MAVIIKWSDEAIETFDKNIQFLQEHWTDREIMKFIKITNEKIRNIKMNPKIYKRSEKHQMIRKCGINKNVSLFFKYFPNKNEVILLSFWNNRRNPKDVKY
jgi:hypothetical protein